MDNFLSSDIFFFLTSAAVLVFTICVVVVTAYVVRILRNVKELSETVRDEGKKITADIDLARLAVKSEGAKVMGVVDSLLGFFRIRKPARKNGSNRPNDLK